MALAGCQPVCAATMARIVLGRLVPPPEDRAELERVALDLPDGTITIVQSATGAALLDLRVELSGVGTSLGATSFGNYQGVLEYLRGVRDRIQEDP
jgi:hypothetical protein